MSITQGYIQLGGGFYKVDDGSGPYSIASDGTVTLIGSGGGGSGGENDVTPKLNAGGNSQVIANDTADTVLPSQSCIQVTVSNKSDNDIYVIQGGNPFPVLGRGYFTFFGLSNANQLSVRTEQGEETVYLRWES